MLSGRRVAFFFLLLSVTVSGGSEGLGASPVAVDQLSGVLSLKNSVAYLVDPGGRMTVQEAASPRQNERFRPLVAGLPWNESGALWLRVSLFRNSPESGRERVVFRLDLGRDAPPARIYWAEKLNPEGEVREWRDAPASRQGILALPDPEFLPMTVYLRLEHLPGFWFDPLLFGRGAVPPDEELAWTLGLRALLALVILICLLRGAIQGEGWRVWGAMALACALIYAMYGDNGAELLRIRPEDVPRLLAPGLAVMILPHLGRYFMDGGDEGILGKTLILFSLPGMILALLPLMPDFGWTARLLPFAPLALLPPFLLACCAFLARKEGGAAYALLLLSPLAGALAAWYSLRFQVELPFRELGPQISSFGWLVTGLFLSLMKGPAPREKKDFFPLDSYLENGGPFMEVPEENPALAAFMREGLYPKDALSREASQAGCMPEWSEGTPITPVYADGNEAVLELDASLRLPDVSVAPSAPDALAMPEDILAEESAPGFADGPGHGALYIRDEEEPGLVLIKSVEAGGDLGMERRPVFNLAELIRHIHEQVLPMAEARGINLSWFVAPSLPLFYQGDADRLSRLIRFLVRGSVEAAESGSVRLTVREALEAEQGRLRFSLLEVCMNIEQMRFPSEWMNQAWEQACASGFVFNMDFAPDQGTTFSFTLDCAPSWDSEQPSGASTPPAEERTPFALSVPKSDRPAGGGYRYKKKQEEPLPPPEDILPPLREYVVLLDPAASGRRLMKRQLEGLPHKPLEAKNAAEALRVCAKHPVGLLLFDADMPESELREAVEQIRAADQTRGMAATPALALLSHESQAERMLRLGCTECLVKFISRSEFQETALRLCPHPDHSYSTWSGLGEDAVLPLHPEPMADKGRRVPLEDMFVLDDYDGSGATDAEGVWRSSLPEDRRNAPALTIVGDTGDFMYAEMLSAIPGFLEALRESLRDLRDSMEAVDLAGLEKAASLMLRQGEAYGLVPLMRMSVCVFEAARSGEAEAAAELAEALAERVQRYLSSLELTHRQSGG
ncbi:MAG: hypothetical protein FWG17_04835 [Desulfovibrionaceae bacterium]|nr:hypothetical protein [Desulfovibrionaceae bacterium]